MRRLAPLLIAGSALLCAAASGPARKSLTLLTSDDAGALRFSEQDWPHITRSRGVEAGPKIVFLQPEAHDTDGGPTVDMTTPGSLVVRFDATQAPIDMRSLQVTARKGFFSKSLTDLLKPYVHGTEVEVEKLDVPSGKFVIEIAIADQQGTQTDQKYRLSVSDASAR